MRRLTIFAAVALAAVLAALAAATTRANGATGELTIVGPWKGADAESFRAVLNRFTELNSGVTVKYTTADGDVASALAKSAGTDAAPDLAVLSLPGDTAAMKELARNGKLESLNFVVPAVRANYAYSWKALGTVDKDLIGLVFKATNRSGIWYDARAFRAAGLTAPSSWSQLRTITAALRKHGLAPFSVSGADAVALPDLFANAYLMIAGNKQYDMLMNGQIPWTSSTVRGALRVMRTMTTGMAGGTSTLNGGYAAAVQRVFGSPMKAVMVPGGSAALPVLYSAKAVRPLSQFGVFGFPRINGDAPRVIGDADAVVMAKDSESARSLVEFLASSEAATIWAKRGGFYLSPNRKVDPAAYASPVIRSLASSLASATTFRPGLADTQSAGFKQKLNSMLAQYLRTPNKVTELTSQLDKAARAERSAAQAG
jgi:alpha-glucoside transport system substrate-binding protein